MMPPDEILKKINEYVCFNYDIDDGHSRHYQESRIATEIEAYKKYIHLFDDIPGDVAREIQTYCNHDDDSSWDDTFCSCKTETESYKCIINFHDSEIDDITVKRLINAAKAYVTSEFGSGEYSLILEIFQKYLSEIKTIRNISREIEPFRELLIEMEEIIASECYNGNIQNYSSWGVWDGEGRFFRYPITFSSPLLEKKEWHIPSRLSTDDLILGKYKFGANHLYIYKALIKVIRHVEEKYNMSLAGINKQ